MPLYLCVASHPAYSEALERLLHSMQRHCPEWTPRLVLTVVDTPRVLQAAARKAWGGDVGAGAIECARQNHFELTSVHTIARLAPWRPRKLVAPPDHFLILHDTMEATALTSAKLANVERQVREIGARPLSVRVVSSTPQAVFLVVFSHAKMVGWLTRDGVVFSSSKTPSGQEILFAPAINEKGQTTLVDTRGWPLRASLRCYLGDPSTQDPVLVLPDRGRDIAVLSPQFDSFQTSELFNIGVVTARTARILASRWSTQKINKARAIEIEQNRDLVQFGQSYRLSGARSCNSFDNVLYLYKNPSLPRSMAWVESLGMIKYLYFVREKREWNKHACVNEVFEHEPGDQG
jgi:hypothetical protein